MPKATESVLEIDLKSLEYNYRYLRAKLKPNTKFLAVVKAFAYGSDMVTVAKKLEQLKVDYFAVAYVKEGVLLRDAGIKTPILVLHPQASNFVELIERCLEPSLYSSKVLGEFLEVAEKLKQKKYPVHIKFNTGLNRLGFKQSDIEYLHEKLIGRKEIKVLSIFSHLAASDDLTEKEFTGNQIRDFEEIAQAFDGKLDEKPFKHLLNTSGIINYPEAQFDMVRSGIGLYGYGNQTEIDSALKPVVTLKTIISQIHKIVPGETVGYNRAYASETYKITATLPLGHADGISRNYGNGKGFVSVGGEKAHIIGNVCMDMIMIDITNIKCQEGDEVVVFGANSSAEELANEASTISYELLTGISRRIKRSIKEG